MSVVSVWGGVGKKIVSFRTKSLPKWRQLSNTGYISKKIIERQRKKRTFWNVSLTKHYENMPVQIYWKFYHQKMKIFR